MDVLLGLAIGVLVTYVIYERYGQALQRKRTESQSAVIVEKIRSVCKLITVEGDFAEIYHYESLKNQWIQKLLGTKRALVLVDAKAFVGFDLTQIKMETDTKTKTVRLYDFPQPTLLSIETDFKYYNKKEGWANPLTSQDHTDIHREAKQSIIDKVPDSGLYREAAQQAQETLLLIERLIGTIGWTLEYSPILINPSGPPVLSQPEY